MRMNTVLISRWMNLLVKADGVVSCHDQNEVKDGHNILRMMSPKKVLVDVLLLCVYLVMLLTNLLSVWVSVLKVNEFVLRLLLQDVSKYQFSPFIIPTMENWKLGP